MITVKRQLEFVRRPNKSLALVASPDLPKPPVPADRLPRLSRLMALAIHFDRLVRDGPVASLSELARLARVTQPRISQILNLNHLAPDIQEALLHLPLVQVGRDPITERDLRPIAALVSWPEQRAEWLRLCQARLRER